MEKLIFIMFGVLIGAGIMAVLEPEQKTCEVCKDPSPPALIDKIFQKAIENCVDKEDWKDYECVRFIYSGRAPSTPAPTASPKPLMYKPYYDKYKLELDEE